MYDIISVTFAYEEFEDASGVIRIRQSKKVRQHNGQKKKEKRTNNNLQNTAQKTTERATRTRYKPRVNPVISHERGKDRKDIP